MISGRRTLIAALVGALAASLMSCHSAPTRIHTLYAVPPASPIRVYAGPAIRIDAVHVPASLDRIEVMSDIGAGELKINEMDHWAAPLSRIAVQALSADMIERLPPDRIIFPHLAKPEGALGVRVDILDFRTNSTGAYLEASWIITSTGPNAISRRGTARFKGPGAGATAADTAQALSALLAQLADRIVADLSS
jgi:hypothetical protein